MIDTLYGTVKLNPMGVAGVPGPLRQEVAGRNVDFAISRFARPAGEEYSEEILFHDALVVPLDRTIH